MGKKLAEPKVSQPPSQAVGPPAIPTARWAGEGIPLRAEPCRAVVLAVSRGLRDPWKRLCLSLSLAKWGNDALLKLPQERRNCVSQGTVRDRERGRQDWGDGSQATSVLS